MKAITSIKYGGILFSILLSYSIFLFCSDEVVIHLTKEDHLYEYLCALFLLAASIMFFIAFLKDKTGNDLILFKTSKNYFLLILAILFFWGFGEDLSWGQRIFNVQTPAWLEQMNYQEETNIHNLKLFRGLLDEGHIFNYFWITFCWIMPFLYKISPAARKFLNKINLPIVPFWLSIFFLISFAFNFVIKLNLSGDLMVHAISEVKETSFCVLFLIFSILCLTYNNR
jgi:hypothetical protein